MNYNYDDVKAMYDKEIKPLEEREKTFLEDGKYYIMRFDGVGMTKRFKPQEALFNWLFLRYMKKTFYVFCKHHSAQICFGFQCNDEISIMIKKIKQDEDNTLNRKEKLLSLFASEISVLFDEYCAKKAPEENPEYVGERLNIFDARIFEVTQEQGLTYFCLRQAFGVEHVITRIFNKTHRDGLDIINALSFLKKRNAMNFQKRKNRTQKFSYDIIKEEEQLFGSIYKDDQEINPFEFDAQKELLNSIIFKKE